MEIKMLRAICPIQDPAAEFGMIYSGLRPELQEYVDGQLYYLEEDVALLETFFRWMAAGEMVLGLQKKPLLYYIRGAAKATSQAAKAATTAEAKLGGKKEGGSWTEAAVALIETRTDICFVCGSADHKSPVCPDRKLSGCPCCGSKEHRIFRCPERKRPTRNNKEACALEVEEKASEVDSDGEEAVV